MIEKKATLNLPSNEAARSPEKEKKPRIIIEDLIKIYKRGKIEVVALRGLSCKFYPGEICIIMGPSGCGKTTLLNLIGGLDVPSSGKIIVDDKNTCALSQKELETFRRNEIGYVFQFMNLIPELSAKENVSLPMLLKGVPAKTREKQTGYLLDLVGMTERAHHKPDELSGGEQQRIAIAAALANDPSILLCDEPTGELDTSSKTNILQILKNIIDTYPDKVIIIVTHDPDLKNVADRLYFIKDGKISREIEESELLKEKALKTGSTALLPGKDLIYKEKIIDELLSLQYLIKERIDKIKSELENSSRNND
ncbi:MAG: ABC transporter ATP-binding protein [Promethearchaeota archaeon]